MNRLFHFIALATFVAAPAVVNDCFASIETAFDSQSLIDQATSSSGQDQRRMPQKPEAEQGNETPAGLPSSISPNASSSGGFGLTGTLLKLTFELQISPNHKVYMKTPLQQPTPPLWEILKVPIVS